MIEYRLVLFLILALNLRMGLTQDTGSTCPLDLIKDDISNYIEDAKKAIPRDQKYSILKRAEKSILGAHDISAKDALRLAHEFRQYLFFEDSRNLYEKVVESKKADQESRVIALRYLGELAFVADDDTPKAIKLMLRARSIVKENTDLHAILLANLGSYYFISEQTEKMREVYEEFIGLKESARNSLPDTLLKANLYIARVAKGRKEAEKYYDQAMKVIESKPDYFAPGLVLSVTVERYGKMRWNSPERIKLLVKLIKQPKNRKLSDVLPLAMDVYLAYLLEADKDWKRFDQFYHEISKLLDEQDQLQAKSKELPHRACQVIATYASLAKSQKKELNEVELRNEFLGWSKRSGPVKFYLPQGVTQKEVGQFQSIFASGLKDALNLKLSGTTKKVPDPKPLRMK